MYACFICAQFGLSIEIAGIVGAVFGLMNIFCRSLGGIASDVAGKYLGMRGRLWIYFCLQVSRHFPCPLLMALLCAIWTA